MAATTPLESTLVTAYESARRAFGETPGDPDSPEFVAAYLAYREAEFDLFAEVATHGDIETEDRVYRLVRGRVRRDPRRQLFNPMGGCRRG